MGLHHQTTNSESTNFFNKYSVWFFFSCSNWVKFKEKIGENKLFGCLIPWARYKICLEQIKTTIKFLKRLGFAFDEPENSKIWTTYFAFVKFGRTQSHWLPIWSWLMTSISFLLNIPLYFSSIFKDWMVTGLVHLRTTPSRLRKTW